MRVTRMAAWLVLVAAVTALTLAAAAAPAAQGPNFRQPIVCDSSVVVSGSAAATAQLVALAAGQRIAVCGFVLSGGGATTAKLVRGTGSACATGTADVTGAFELADNVTLSYGGGVGTVARLPIGEALCWTNSGAVQVSGLVTYARF